MRCPPRSASRSPSPPPRASCRSAPPPPARCRPLGPAEIQQAYALPADAGAGLTVAIVDAYGYDNAEADLAVWRDHYGLTPCTTGNGCFRKIDQRGGTDYPVQDEGWAMETALDLDAVSASCPRCDILLVQGDSANMADLGEAVNTAAALGVAAISNSYGMNYETPYAQEFDQYYDHPGVAITVSSGDDGNVQSYPATSPLVTGIGGTYLARADSARGWAETAWDEAGSGCSDYEPKPDFQTGIATNCASRASADISAVADPASGLSVYGTFGLDGWAQIGGTSLSAPLVAGMYALAGKPTPGTYPVTYPYAGSRGLFDVTEGINGSCGNVLCQAGPGWDGPTGLGSPQGVTALTLGDIGQVTGTVTAAGQPLAGATITATGAEGAHFTATTDADGTYDLFATAGTYTLTTTKFGYATGTAAGVVITTGEQVTTNFTLTALASKLVSGKVTDGSGHGWPMRAKLTIDGYPDGAFYSDAFSGEYSVNLPVGTDYTVHAEAADLTGYQAQTFTVAVKNANVKKDIALPVDAESCAAPGYAVTHTGLFEDFTGWSGTDVKDGWTVTDAAGTGQTWNFDNARYNTPPGSDGDIAFIDSDVYGETGEQDTTLVSPIVDLTGHANPVIGFDTTYIGFPDQTGTVDLSLDGGATWTTVFDMWTWIDHFELAVPQAAGHSDVRLRFHYTGSWSRSWQIDNVLVGTDVCAPVAGGLVAGFVSDANTGKPLTGAVVTSDPHPTEFAVTTATPEDPALADGYYWLFSSQTGSVPLSVTDGFYTAAKTKVSVKANALKQVNVKLTAGLLTVNRGDLAYEETLGDKSSQTLTFGNDGAVPVKVHLGEDSGGFTPLAGTAAGTGAPDLRVPTELSTGDVAGTSTAQDTATPRQANPAALPWSDLTDYPVPVMDNVAAAHDGKVYSVGGTSGYTRYSSAYVLDPQTQQWSAIAELPKPIAGLTGGFLGDKLYVTGGWDGSTGLNRATYAYDPATNAWTQVADLPGPAAVSGTAVVAGKLYVVGGCSTGGSACTQTDKVYSYDPATDVWSTAPAYPSVVAYLACGGLQDELVCAGGTAGGGRTLSDTYTLKPGATAWVKKAAMPGDVWGGAATAANGKLQIIGGAVAGGTALSNQAVEYDPAADAWTRLPNANNATYRGAAACGLYTVGGAIGSSFSTWWVQNLAGYGDCGQDVSWLAANKTDFTVQPGRTVTVKVTADSSKLSRLGTYQATLNVTTNTPYRDVAPVTVSLTTTPPASWGQLIGTVKDKTGKVIGGATVALCPAYDTATGECGPTTYTLKTDAAGAWHLWLDSAGNPVQIIAAKDGYTPAMRIATVKKGETVTADFALAANAAMTAAKVGEYLTGTMQSK
ncbi:hypothetical protein GCM10010435_49900 [Winogradskya consettensis]|uniref:Peptidase S53 domain-containing protein n=1 Tax=Winogradskya consettensis TaxID=113560 RepID=A0A919W531_9ACTN|nr:carboxypeptidase regulatory-like domain-containing protein [Actinoplanes consettensis]GIM80083.1 hypothetical protein Aco04nite_68810 [Actinoplanes consettensis]